MTDKITLKIDTKHSTMVSFALWNALGEALRVIGETRGNDGWKEDLYDLCLQYTENLRDAGSEGDPTKIDELKELVNADAQRAAADAITAAFDRLKFVE